MTREEFMRAVSPHHDDAPPSAADWLEHTGLDVLALSIAAQRGALEVVSEQSEPDFFIRPGGRRMVDPLPLLRDAATPAGVELLEAAMALIVMIECVRW